MVIFKLVCSIHKVMKPYSNDAINLRLLLTNPKRKLKDSRKVFRPCKKISEKKKNMSYIFSYIIFLFKFLNRFFQLKIIKHMLDY